MGLFILFTCRHLNPWTATVCTRTVTGECYRWVQNSPPASLCLWQASRKGSDHNLNKIIAYQGSSHCIVIQLYFLDLNTGMKIWTSSGLVVHPPVWPRPPVGTPTLAPATISPPHSSRSPTNCRLSNHWKVCSDHRSDLSFSLPPSPPLPHLYHFPIYSLFFPPSPSCLFWLSICDT